jgi:carbon-monoxide dehydrogenase small subunit
MSTRAMLDNNPNPTDEEIIETLSGNLCRCTGYIPIMNAVKRTVERERKELGR